MELRSKIQFNYNIVPRRLLDIIFTLAIILIAPAPAFSLHFNTPHGGLDIDTTFDYGISLRLDDADAALLADPNGDDGNRAFDKWNLVMNRFAFRTDAEWRFKNVGLFTRVRGFYDDVYNRRSAHDSPETHNSLSANGSGPLTDHQRFTDKTQGLHAKTVELLDLYAYGNFDVGGLPLMLRLGRQVVSWGESLLTFNSISAAMSYADATKLNVPGLELKDLFLPSTQAYGEFNITPLVSISGYYQWEWKRNTLDAAGSYFSTADYYDVGGYHLLGLDLPRGTDNRADNNGQYGVALRFIVPFLNDADIGFFHVNYHEKFPMLKIGPQGGAMAYYLDYAEDIDLYGFSASTVVGNTSWAGEVSYRKDLPLQAGGTGSYQPFDVVQVIVNAIHVFGPVGLMDNLSLTVEGGFNNVLDADGLDKDTTAWGYLAKLSIDWFQVYPELDLNVPIIFKHKVNGKSAIAGTWTENENEVSLGFDFSYKQSWKFGVKYVDFLGDATDYAKSDRDYVSVNIKRTF